MKNHLKQAAAFLLIFVFMCSFIQLPAAAANNELVLTKIGHISTNTVTITSSTTRTITLTVPYGHQGDTLDLSTGMIIEKGSNIASFTSDLTNNTNGSIAIIDGPALKMTVEYTRKNNSKDSTEYSVTVKRAQAPTYSGSISKSHSGANLKSKMNEIRFERSDFINKNFCSGNQDSVEYISIKGNNLICGTLKFNSENYNFNTKIPVGDISSLAFDAEASGNVTYLVYAHFKNPKNNGTISAGPVELNITVNAVSVPTIKSAISKSVAEGSTITFSLNDFTNCCDLKGGKLDSITIKPASTDKGTWYNGSTRITGSATFNSSTINNLKFTSHSNSSNSSVSFTWTVTNEAGSSSPGSGVININNVSVPTIISTVTKTASVGSTTTFTSYDFTSRCNMNNGSLEYIEITPTDSGYGTWYNGSTPFTSTTTFTANSIRNLKFVPSTYGTTSFTWRISNQSGFSSMGTGTVTISGGMSLSYSTAVNTPVNFKASDFYSDFYNETGQMLSYVKFSLPQPNYGILYYNYSSDPESRPVSEITPYYVGYSYNNKYIDNITLVPAADYSGTFTMAYTGYSETGVSNTGFIQINIVGQATGTGTVTYSTAKNTAVNFKSLDFNTAFYNATGSSLSYVTFTLPDAYYGKLYYNYANSGSSLVNANTPYFVIYSLHSQSLNNISFVPSSGFTGTVTISYKGYTDTGISYSGNVQIYVGTSGLPNTGQLTYTTAKNNAITFIASDFQNMFKYTTGKDLSHVYFSQPSNSLGTLYYNYASSFNQSKVSAASPYFVGIAPYLDLVTFVPTSNYTGTVSIPYAAYSVDNTSITGYIQINVGTTGADSGSITYTTAKNTPITFNSSEFTSAYRNATGKNLSYVFFTLPSSNTGTLYYNYASAANRKKVTATTPYFIEYASYLDNVTFVPANNYTGTVTISYTGFDTNGDSATGYVKINVGYTGPDSGSVSYTTAKNTEVTIKSKDLASAFLNTTGKNLSYVFFTLPASNTGKLYYNYSSVLNRSQVSGTTPYFLDNAPYLDNVTFVPANNYIGTVTISYTGYDSDGNPSTGYIQINIGTAGSSSVTYTTAKNTPITLKSEDLASAFLNATGKSLSYIFFQLPASSTGSLYYNYASALNRSPVSATTPYFVDKAPYLDYVTFVPSSNYIGTVTISYTGYDSDGNPTAGYLQINVGTGTETGTLTYNTAKNTPVNLKSNDLVYDFYNATGSNLSYVQFSLPPSAAGKLYYDYDSPSNRKLVLSSNFYFVSVSPYLDDITFVPEINYTGKVKIPYTGYSANGYTSITGYIEINVGSTDACVVNYTVDKNKNVAFKVSDFSNSFKAATGSTLSFVTFTLPPATTGTLYYNYISTSVFNTSVTEASKYGVNTSPYLAYVTFVPKDNYTGVVSIPFTGYSTNGISYAGTVKITIRTTQSNKPSPFTDLGSYSSWAQEAIDYLYNNGIIIGTGNNFFSPGSNIKRGDFILMLHRTFGFTSETGSNYADVPKGSYYYEAIAAAKALGITSEAGSYFNPQVPLTRQDAMYYTYRAMLVSGTPLPSGSASDIATFIDKGDISDYAVNAVQSLVKSGIIKGNTESKLNPLGNLSRAEMAVILYRALVL